MVWDLRRGLYTKSALHSNQGKEVAENGVVCHLVINNDKNQLLVMITVILFKTGPPNLPKEEGPQSHNRKQV